MAGLPLVAGGAGGQADPPVAQEPDDDLALIARQGDRQNVGGGPLPHPLQAGDLGGEPLEVAVLAAADAEVLFLNSVQALSCARPGAAEFTRNLLTILAGRNLTLTRKIGHMARRTTRDKLLSYLSAQAMQAGGPEFDIPLDRQQLADYLAVDRSAMSTALGKLRDEGVLTFQKNHFHLLQQMEQTD